MKSILLVKKFLGLVEMTSGLVNASFSLPKWQAVKMIFFVPCHHLVTLYAKRKATVFGAFLTTGNCNFGKESHGPLILKQETVRRPQYLVSSSIL